MWDLIVSVPDHCLSFYFTLSKLTWSKLTCSNDEGHNGEVLKNKMFKIRTKCSRI